MAALLKEREKIDHELKALEEAAKILRPAYATLQGCAGIEPDNVGITDAVRAVLKASGHYMVPTAIRDGLKQTGLLKDYPNEMAVIHEVLRRLARNDEADVQDGPHGKAYAWKPKLAHAPKTLQELAAGPTRRAPSMPPPGATQMFKKDK